MKNTDLNIHTIANLMHQQSTQMLKNGDTTTVVLAKLATQSIVIKRYNSLGLWHKLTHCWRPTRAARCWFISMALQRANVAVAEPLCMLENRCGPLRGSAYFVTAAVAGPNLLDLLTGNTLTQAELHALANKVVDLIETLHQHGFAHRDLKATNILIKNGEPLFIDLDATQQIRWPWLRQHRQNKDLQRFMKNWRQRPDLLELFKHLFQKRQHFRSYTF